MAKKEEKRADSPKLWSQTSLTHIPLYLKPFLDSTFLLCKMGYNTSYSGGMMRI